MRKLINGQYVAISTAPKPEGLEGVRLALLRLRAEDDAHWDKQGRPDLNVLTEFAGFRVKRGAVEEVAKGVTREGFTVWAAGQ